MWQRWRKFGALPRAGGWLDQPLKIMYRIQAIEMVYTASEFIHAKDADWTKMSTIQKEIAQWIGRV